MPIFVRYPGRMRFSQQFCSVLYFLKSLPRSRQSQTYLPMQMFTRPILIIAVFWNKKKKLVTARQAPDHLAEAFETRGGQVIKTSYYLNKFLRLVDTIATVVMHAGRYKIAIVPWFNGAGSFYWQEIASRLLKLLRRKVILVVHGGAVPGQIAANPSKYLKTLRRADAIVSPSAFVADKLQHMGFAVDVIENLVETDVYPFIQKDNFRLNLLWMRTIEEVYNPLMALQVVKILNAKGLRPMLYMAGQVKDDDLYSTLRKKVEEWQLEEQVVFTGYADHTMKLDLASKCDMYICTNKVDNAPVSVVEMMCLGLPVITTNVGGIPYLVKDGETGLLVNDDDAEAMAAAIEMIYSQPGLGKEIAGRAFLFSRRFNAEEVLEKWMQLFARLEPGEYTVQGKQTT